MVVDDLNVRSAIPGPNKANSPLLVNADAVLPLSVVLQCFESIPGGDFQVVKNYPMFMRYAYDVKRICEVRHPSGIGWSDLLALDGTLLREVVSIATNPSQM